MRNTYDVVVIGGGPAGLQAALTLGRMHRTTLLIDSGSYRNDPADHLHNLISHDGRPPAELRALALADLEAYDSVERRAGHVATVHTADDGFAVSTGGGVVEASAVVLATGVRDHLPDKPGLGELFGSAAAHCPFCHGHEYAGRPVAVLGGIAHLVALMLPIAGTVVALTDGAEPAEDLVELRRRHPEVQVRTAAVLGFEPAGDGARVAFADGASLEVGGVLCASAYAQAAPFAEQLGLDLLPDGAIAVDARARTSLSGVFAAGDAAHVPELPMGMHTVAGAVASGLTAAASAVAHLLERG